MAIKNRETYTKAFYHVYARGARRMELFFSEKSFSKLLYIFEDASKKFLFKVHDFCEMHNHYHFLIETFGEKEEITNLIHYVHTRFGMFFNSETGLSGHVFEERFESKVVYDRRGLLRLIRYIERNPVKAKIVHQCEDWQWSLSFLLQNKNKFFSFIDYDFTLNFFKDSPQPLEEFIRFINYDDPDEKFFDPLNMNKFIIHKIDQYLLKNPITNLQELGHTKIYLYKELTNLTLKEIHQLLMPEKTLGSVRKIYSRIKNSKSNYSMEITQNTNALRKILAPYM